LLRPSGFVSAVRLQKAAGTALTGVEAMVKRAGGRTIEVGRFDAFRLATRSEVMAGEIDLSGRSRVVDRIAPVAVPMSIEWRIEGGRDDLERPMLTLTLHGSVTLVCQRCLQSFAAAIDRRSELLLAHDESELARLDAEEREVVLASAPLDARTLVEDEVLLSLPFAPMHPEGRCPAESADAGSASMKHDTPSPFARLAAIKRRPDSI
jgi:DUF177 domain-containing protein